MRVQMTKRARRRTRAALDLRTPAGRYLPY